MNDERLQEYLEALRHFWAIHGERDDLRARLDDLRVRLGKNETELVAAHEALEKAASAAHTSIDSTLTSTLAKMSP